MKEAVRTSVLSRRWKKLWQFFSGSLSFCPKDAGIDFNYRLESDLKRKELKRESSRFVTWVNKVLNSHQGKNIDEMRVEFDLDKDLGSNIDTWIDIALTKKVKKLVLINFPSLTPASELRCYSLTQETFSCNKTSCGLSGNQFLSHLALQDLGVSDEFMEYILSNCPLLETLKVYNSPQLKNPKCSGSSLMLKHLSIASCQFVQSVEVCAPNLISFQYSGREIPLHIRNVTKLQEFYYSNIACNNFLPSKNFVRPNLDIPLAFSQLPNCYLPQLVTLKLIMPFKRLRLQADKFPIVMSLKRLICRLTLFHGESLLFLTSMIEAAPFLHKFTLEVENHNKTKSICNLRKLPKMEGHPNQYLKEVCVFGFLGQDADAEIVTYLLKSALMLKEIVIDIGYSHSGERMSMATQKMAKNLARQLVENNRPEAELVLLGHC
ncbi:hypothetical protein PTKIN_Ptkin01aG0317500 [Pterospermum kingtungense]